MGQTLSKQLAVAEQRSRILTLVRRGASADQVADLLANAPEAPIPDITATDVRKTVKQALLELRTEDSLAVDELRTQENARLDEAMKAIYKKVLDGDIKAIGLFLKISARRAALNGLDAPQKIEFSAPDALAAMGIAKELIERHTEAFKTAYADDQIPEVIDVEGQEVQAGDEEGPARALESGSGGGGTQEPTDEEALRALAIDLDVEERVARFKTDKESFRKTEPEPSARALAWE